MVRAVEEWICISLFQSWLQILFVRVIWLQEALPRALVFGVGKAYCEPLLHKSSVLFFEPPQILNTFWGKSQVLG